MSWKERVKGKETVSKDQECSWEKSQSRLGVVAHACNLNTLGGQGGGHKVRSSRLAWPTWWNPISTKNTKINQVWRQAPVIPATQEAEAGKSLEHGRWRLQWAKITSLHSSSKKKKKEKRSQSRVTRGSTSSYSSSYICFFDYIYSI